MKTLAALACESPAGLKIDDLLAIDTVLGELPPSEKAACYTLVLAVLDAAFRGKIRAAELLSLVDKDVSLSTDVLVHVFDTFPTVCSEQETRTLALACRIAKGLSSPLTYFADIAAEGSYDHSSIAAFAGEILYFKKCATAGRLFPRALSALNALVTHSAGWFAAAAPLVYTASQKEILTRQKSAF